MYDSTRRTFSSEKTLWTRVRIEEVAPIVGFLLAGIVASVVVLLMERATATRVLLQHYRNVFCCIAAVRYVDGDQPADPDSSQRNALGQVEEDPGLRDLECQGSSQLSE